MLLSFQLKFDSHFLEQPTESGHRTRTFVGDLLASRLGPNKFFNSLQSGIQPSGKSFLIEHLFKHYAKNFY
jgi:hypothetical protein